MCAEVVGAFQGEGDLWGVFGVGCEVGLDDVETVVVGWTVESSLLDMLRSERADIDNVEEGVAYAIPERATIVQGGFEKGHCF